MNQHANELAFNRLSPAEVERIALLSEELGEVLIELSRQHPAPFTNVADLETEIGDVTHIVELMLDADDFHKLGIDHFALIHKKAIKVTDDQEALAVLQRCAGRLIQAIGKTLRHGYESMHPRGGPTNRLMLMDLIGLWTALVEDLSDQGRLSVDNISAAADAKAKRLPQFLHHQ